jgi:DNA polymerase-3 subunit epsilon
MKEPKEILWIDCETGGTDSKIHALLQLSAIIEIDGKEVDSIDLKMKPVKGKIIEEKALEVQGRTMQDIESFDDPIECYMKFSRFLARRPPSKTNRYTMGGYSAEFDCRFVEQWFRDIAMNPYAYWKYMQFSPVDPLAILRALRHYSIIETENTKLETVCKYFGIEIKAHDSMSDIRATMQLTKIIMHRIGAGWWTE